MIVGRCGSPGDRPGEIVRTRTLLATVRGPRYSPNMCSPIASSAAYEPRLSEED